MFCKSAIALVCNSLTMEAVYILSHRLWCDNIVNVLQNTTIYTSNGGRKCFTVANYIIVREGSLFYIEYDSVQL